MTIQTAAAPAQKLTTLRFTLHSLKFTPYKELAHLKNGNIITSVFGYLNRELFARRGHVVDRNKNKANEDERVLFVTLSNTLPNSRILGTIALLRNGRVPWIKPKETYELVPIDRANGEIYEQSHFFIDYSKENVVICMEFNNNGPRLSDLEFYLRNVASDKLGYARSVSVVTHMNSRLDDALENLANVLSFEVKAEPAKLDNLDMDMRGYFSGMTTLATRVKPRALSVKAHFQKKGKKKGANVENTDANNMIRLFLQRFKRNPDHLDNFDNFEVKYEDKEGMDHTLQLLTGKMEILAEVDIANIPPRRTLYNLILNDFDTFVASL